MTEPDLRADVVMISGAEEHWMPNVFTTNAEAAEIVKRFKARGGNNPDGVNTLAAVYPHPDGFNIATWRV
ncbi:hypothetical protein [Corynebacterium glyciniphilum]|uniref:hypothetical protein n=1 Tax=Corynebacterium glyciniphilum TaxID=1404244 RepID=UPI002655BECC|nr:hypothetical protein [Corynebacterium glyciniphilum]MDN6706412.1 hypothetical protein [Corynebacterium glyciniphilum]